MKGRSDGVAITSGSSKKKEIAPGLGDICFKHEEVSTVEKSNGREGGGRAYQSYRLWVSSNNDAVARSRDFRCRSRTRQANPAARYPAQAKGSHCWNDGTAARSLSLIGGSAKCRGFEKHEVDVTACVRGEVFGVLRGQYISENETTK